MQLNKMPGKPKGSELPFGFREQMKNLNWFEQYELIEHEVKTHPEMTREQIAGWLGIEPEIVSRAMKIMTVLNANSRRMIRENLQGGKDGIQ